MEAGHAQPQIGDQQLVAVHVVAQHIAAEPAQPFMLR